jgi:hypothetical protein
LSPKGIEFIIELAEEKYSNVAFFILSGFDIDAMENEIEKVLE